VASLQDSTDGRTTPGLYNGNGSWVDLESHGQDPRRTAIAEVALQFRGTEVRGMGMRLRTWKLWLRISRLLSVLKRVITRIQTDDCSNLAAQMSFYFVLSLVPFFLVLASIVGWLPTTNLWQNLVEWITTYLPQGSRRVIFTVALDLTRGYTKFLSLGLLAMIWSASSGFVSLMEALSIAHGARETRGFWKRRIIAVAATLAAAIFFLLSFALTTLGHTAAELFAHRYSAFTFSKLPWDVARWVANLLVILTAINLINYFLPNVKQAWHWITTGTSFVTLSFFLATFGFDFYVQHASNIPRIYGTLAGFIIFMIWIYIANFILLVGAETDTAIKEWMDAGASA
jgi:membrane protein